ncbi:hypothetical protein HCH52_03870 [Oscillospiraceae bacterium HV4-5-C5C]|nr:hypothetical protein [Oscillospiraceae bacterium HV4-5-C5C]
MQQAENAAIANKRLMEASAKAALDYCDQSSYQGIGRLGEKTLHRVIKYYLQPESSYHELACGPYYADIINEKDELLEIQTREFSRLREKLKTWLPDRTVTVVYPIAFIKRIAWIDPRNGTVSPARKSPKPGRWWDVLPELYKIRPYIIHPNFRLRLIGLDLIEYRSKNGWSHDGKRGSTRYDRVPQTILAELYLDQSAAYKSLLPQSLSSPFTAKIFGQQTKLSAYQSSLSLIVLRELKVVRQIGKEGRAYLYELS